MKVDKAAVLKDYDLHRQKVAWINEEVRSKKIAEEHYQLTKEIQHKSQALRIERNKRLGSTKGLNVDLYS